MIKKVLLAGGLIFTCYLGQAQGGAQVNNFKNQTNVFAPSPNAAALAKYAEIPVNTHTGIPGISVPIYEWKSKKGNASLNVGLSYHAGGIKVEDVATNVGTGWALNASGVITRSVRGRADDDPFGYINRPVIADFNTYRYDGGYYLPDPSYTVEYGSSDTARSNIIAWFNNPTNDQDIMHYLYTGAWDTEQDMFFYNIAGYAGKFVLGKNGDVNKIDDNALEISVHYNVSGPYSLKEIDYFTIQGDNGIKYIFDYKESSEANTATFAVNYGTSGPAPVIPTFDAKTINTAFHVSKAIDLNSNDTILYQYSQRTIKYMGGWNESQTYHDNDQPSVLIPTGVKTEQKISSHTFSCTGNSIGSYNIKRIILPDSTLIDFYYDQERTDIAGDSALTRVEVTDITGASRKYRLSYGYISSGPALTGNNSVWGFQPDLFSSALDYTSSNDHFYTRLRLDAVRQVSAWSGGDSLLVSSFVYNDTVLPPRSSIAIDYWGYYCGPERNSTTLIPQVEPAIPESLTTEGVQSGFNYAATLLNVFTEGADRSPHELYARASVLKRINLPTGGHTDFRFKTNSVKDPIYPNSNTRYFQYISPVTDYHSLVDINFQERTDTAVLFYISFLRANDDGTPYIPPPPSGGPYSCIASDVSTSFSINFVVKSTDNTVTKSCSFYGVDSGQGFVKVYFSLPLDKSYRYNYTYVNGGGPCLDTIKFVMGTNIKYGFTNTNNLVGGLRVEGVDYYDPVAATAIHTAYDYNNDSGYVSGILPVIPNYNFNVRAIGEWSCCEGTCGSPYFMGYAKYKTRTSSSTQTLGYSSGSNAGYTKVSTSKITDAGRPLGKTVERFTGSVLRNYYDVFPYMTTQLIDWKSGHKWEEAVYDSFGTLQRRTNSSYLDVEDSLVDDNNRSIRMSCIRSENCGDATDPIAYERLVAHSFYPHHGRSFLSSQRVAEFSGPDSVVQTTNYTYNYDGYIYTSTTGPNSKGLNTMKNYHYPSEYTHTALVQLVTNKVKNIPVASRTTQWKASPSVNNEIQGEGADYDVYSSFARPRYFYQRSSADATVHGTFDASTVKTDIDEVTGEVTAYDSYGNVAEFLGRDGVRVAIIWGYRGTLPVAKIIGATYSDAVSKLSTITYANLQLLTNETTLRAKLDEIRQGYSSAPTIQVTTMTAKPLLGTTSETNANGKTTYYEYDAFGRLKLIRDQDGNILKTFDYKYQQAQNQ